jgi:hypothetical protein
MTKRGLLVLTLPLLALAGLLLAAGSLRREQQPSAPVKRVVRVVDGVEIVESVPEPVAVAPSRPPARPSERAVRPRAPRPAPTDIAEAAELARIQSTYQNYRTAAVTANEDLRKTLLEVLRRDGAAAREFARDDVEMAETEADRALARKLLAELTR